MDDGLLEGRRVVDAAKGRELGDDGASTGGFADDGYGLGVSAETTDVGLDPLQGEALVVEAGVGADVEHGRLARREAKKAPESG